MISILSSTGDFSFTITGELCDHFLGHNIINNLGYVESQMLNNSIQVNSTQIISFDIPTQFILGGDSDPQGVLTTNSGEKYQAVHFGTGLTDEQADRLSVDLVNLIQAVDDTDENEQIELHADPDVNRILYAIRYRRGWSSLRSRYYHMDVLPDSMIKESDETQNIAAMVEELKSSGAWDKISVMYLPVFRDAEVNKINFKCPDINNIESWNALQESDNTYAGYTTDQLLTYYYGDLLNHNDIPAPKAMYMADRIDQDVDTMVYTWSDLTGNGHHLTSKPNPLAPPPENSHSPTLTDQATRRGSKRGVRFGASRSHRMVWDDSNPVNKSDFKHIFITYRMRNWGHNGRRGTLFDFGSSSSWSAAVLGVGHDDAEYGSPTNIRGSWKTRQINGYNVGTQVMPMPYWDHIYNRWRGGISNYGFDKQGWQRTVADDPMFMYGTRILHFQHADATADVLSHFALGTSASDTSGWCVQGDVMDVIIYDQELTTDQVNMVHGYLAMKHDVNLNPTMSDSEHVHSIRHNFNSLPEISFRQDADNGVATPFTANTTTGAVATIKSTVNSCATKAYDVMCNFHESETPYLGPITGGINRTEVGINFSQFDSTNEQLYLAPGFDVDVTRSTTNTRDLRHYLMCRMSHFSYWRHKPADASGDSHSAFYFFNDKLTTEQMQSVGRSHQLLMRHLGGSTAGTETETFSPDAAIDSYVSRLASRLDKTREEMLDDPRVTSVIEFINRGKLVGWWDRIAACYFPVWRDEQLNGLNLKNPGVQSAISGSNVTHCNGPYIETLGHVSGNLLTYALTIPISLSQLKQLCCEPPMDMNDWTTFDYHFVTHYKKRNTYLSWGGTKSTSWGNYVFPGPYRYNGNGSWGKVFVGTTTWGSCYVTDAGAFKPQTKGTYFESVVGVGDIFATWDGTEVVRSIDCSTNTNPIPNQSLVYNPGGGHAGNQVDFISVGVKFDHTTERDMIDDYVDAVDQLTATLIDTVSSSGAGSIATSTNPITVHGAVNLHNTDQSAMLISAKNDLTIYDQQVPESLETTSQPFTAIWDDDRIWNWDSGDHKQYGPIYTEHGSSTSTGYLVPCAVGYRMRYHGVGWPGGWNQVAGGNIVTTSARGTTCFIRGKSSGAIRRSTFGYGGNVYNDSASNSEDRILKFKILPDSPERGLFIAGGSPPWRLNDTCCWTGESISYPGRGDASSSSNWLSNYTHGPEQDRFWNNLSNDKDFIPGEALDIVHFDNLPYMSGEQQLPSNYQRGAPIQDNISFFNGKYRVAEVTDLQQPLEDGDVFDSESYTTYGGPAQPTNPGESTPLRAWMRVEMSPIETIDIGPTNQHDLVLFANTTMSDSVSADWINRFYLGGVDEYQYRLHVDNEDNMYVCGTYRDYMVVNYNLNINEKYSVVLDEFGKPQDELQLNPSGENSQAFLTMHDPASGQIITCLSTRGVGKNKGTAAISNSTGDIYMTGQVSGKVRFEADHGWWKYADRGVNTGSTQNTFGFLAKVSKKEWMLNNNVKYKPIDYTWDWIVYVDAPEHALSGDRMLSDVGVDTADSVYTAGYFSGPTEIGMSGAAKPDDSETFQFEPGYKWVDESDEQVFLCKWSDKGKCKWSSVYSCVGLNHDSIYVKFHDDLMYFVCVADTITTSSTSSGLLVSRVNISTGEFTWISTIQGVTSCTGITITDTGNIHITGKCDTTLTSTNVTLGGNADVTSPSGYSLLMEPSGNSAVVTIHTSSDISCDGTTQSTSTGRGVTIGTCSSDVSITAGTQSTTIQTSEANKYFIYKMTHEL